MFKKIILALACLPALAHAQLFTSTLPVHGELSGGGVFDVRGPDGLWIQDALSHSWQPTAPAFKLGLTGNLYASSAWGVDWHADYMWLGMVHARGDVTSDSNYDAARHACLVGCSAFAYFSGSGHDYGFAPMIETYVNAGEWRFGVEGGPWIHHNQWSEDVTVFDPASSIHLGTDGRWTVGYVAGITAHYESVDVELLYFANKQKSMNQVPPIWVGAVGLFVGAHF